MKFSHQFAEQLPDMTRPVRVDLGDTPRVAVLNRPLADSLGLNLDKLRDPQAFTSDHPVAQAYAGHQFGSFSPILGDGRSALLGEITVPKSKKLVDVHLKGSGRNAFSRPGSDGRAALGPMLREYIVSEALHALGIPTSRILAILTTGDTVHRDTDLPGAIAVRIASSHIRVGSFELARRLARSDVLSDLVAFTAARHLPGYAENRAVLDTAEHRAMVTKQLLDHTVKVQSELIALWMAYGFVHGVMNTDNMTISGETLDLGPCAFLDDYNPRAVFSSIDTHGRYAYGNQPARGEWNLSRFAETLLPLMGTPDEAFSSASASLQSFASQYKENYATTIQHKLGMVPRPLAEELVELMSVHQPDFTQTFRYLTDLATGTVPAPAGVIVLASSPAAKAAAAKPRRSTGRGKSAAQQFSLPAAFTPWIQKFMSASPKTKMMEGLNPVYIPRNHLVDEVIDTTVASVEDGAPNMRELNSFVELLRDPFTRKARGYDRFELPAPVSYRPVTFCGT